LHGVRPARRTGKGDRRRRRRDRQSDRYDVRRLVDRRCLTRRAQAGPGNLEGVLCLLGGKRRTGSATYIRNHGIDRHAAGRRYRGASDDHGAHGRRRVTAAEYTTTMQASVIKMKLPARPENLGLVREALEGVAEGLGITEGLLGDVKMAVTEACT